MKLVVVHSIHVWLSQTNTWLFSQVSHLSESIESHVHCLRTDNLDQFQVPNIHCEASLSPSQKLLNRALLRSHLRKSSWFLSKVSRECGAQILHSHFGDVAWRNSSAARDAGVRHVVTFYGVDMSYMPKSEPWWLERYSQLFEQTDKVLCEGQHMAQGLIKIGCPKEKIQVHHLGVNVEAIPFKSRRWSAQEPLRILIAASFREKKGIPYALEAVGRLKKYTPLEVTLIGDAHSETRSQNEKERILATVEKFDLGSKIRFLGFQSHERLFEEAYQHHLFISPSITAVDGDTEGGVPVTIIEMVASGMPVVSTHHCDIPAVFPGELREWLAPEKDVDGLLCSIKKWVDAPDNWFSALETCRRHIESEYNARKQGQKLSEIYFRLNEA